jgi:hypothetical protein
MSEVDWVGTDGRADRLRLPDRLADPATVINDVGEGGARRIGVSRGQCSRTGEAALAVIAAFGLRREKTGAS